MDINDLLTRIAVYRCKMNRFSKGKELTDPDVIKLSQGLDRLIHEYLDFRSTENRASQ